MAALFPINERARCIGQLGPEVVDRGSQYPNTGIHINVGPRLDAAFARAPDWDLRRAPTLSYAGVFSHGGALLGVP